MRKPSTPRPGGNRAHAAAGEGGVKVSSTSFSDAMLSGVGCEMGTIERRGSTTTGNGWRGKPGFFDRVFRSM